MFHVSIDKILPVTEARANIAKLIDQVERGNVYVLTRGGKPVAVVAPINKTKNLVGKEKQTVDIVESKPIEKELIIKKEEKSDIQSSDTEKNIPVGIDMKKVEKELAKYSK